MAETLWSCKIGSRSEVVIPDGADFPMRQAVKRAYFELTGEHAEFTFSGWGASLTEPQLAVVENREPVAVTAADIEQHNV